MLADERAVWYAMRRVGDLYVASPSDGLHRLYAAIDELYAFVTWGSERRPLGLRPVYDDAARDAAMGRLLVRPGADAL